MNKSKVKTAREIVKFIDKTARELKNDERLAEVLMSGIRSEIVEGIRRVQRARGFHLNKINSIKVSAFRTLLGYADNPEKLNEGHVRKKETRKPKTREKEDGFVPPSVELVREVQMTGSGKLRITGAVINRHKHPIQNVELEIDTGDGISVQSAAPFDWSVSRSIVNVGFLEASLEDGAMENKIVIILSREGRRKSFKIKGRVHYDNTEIGKRESREFTSAIKT